MAAHLLQEIIDAQDVAIRELQRTIDEQNQEIERLSSGTVLLLAEDVYRMVHVVDDLRRRMSALDGRPFREPYAMVEH
jgi:hypothetical protein